MADSNKPIVPGGDTVGTVGEVYLSKNGKTYECVAVIDNTTVTPNGETIPRVEYVWVCTDDGAGGGAFPFDVSDAEPITISRTKEELIAAIDAGKTPIGYWRHTQSNGTVIRLFHFVKRFDVANGTNLTFYFFDKTSSGVLDIKADGTIKRTYQNNDSGGVSGSANFTFTITPTNGPGSQMLSATRAEMLAALDAGKTLLGYWTETRTILETTDTIKHEFRLESVSGTGADRGLAFVNYEQFYKSTLYVNGNDTVSFVDKEVLPNPTTKTEAMTQSVGMDNDGRLWTEPGASGGGGVQSDWNQNDDTQPDYIKNKPLIVIPFKPAGKSYLTFSSPNSFNLAVENATKPWDGTLEYFSSDKTWTTWDGTSTLSAIADDGEYVLYLRGTGNTVITGNGIRRKWVLTGSDIACIGNIENLLDYATVESGEHPTMAYSCYYNMFSGCTSLTQAPALPATTLADGCYRTMFSGCTSLTQAPALPATTLADYCYAYMFSGCTSLTQAPALPATTLASNCYYYMFFVCTSLTQAPALPATTLASNCYYNMFKDCTSLKLSSTQTDEYTQEYRIPSSGDGATATDALTNMFASTGGTFKGTPTINTTYYLSSDNMIVRETEIATLNGYVRAMINVAIDKYADTVEYIIPSSTQGSTKKFKITVDDTGTLSATEVTETT